ncbi:hypothetical protein GETHLI_04840 [Geothrix limicola]|uniref:DUF1579 domain-containing protein n=1 Tax=Geothrix limicola TaxID=2927978 RepID=A0ABQ5QBA4_9BACT|nr:hypothetical protein [Geothrix limicola]GLH71982.1 hypothetical protein GETHLI_04840 [Geothrix limicola]
MRSTLLSLALITSLGAQAPAPASVPAPATDPFGPVRFLAGEWVGEGGGRPGQSSGAATFQFELGGQVLTRRSYADSPAGGGRPASHHEDQMTVFLEGGQLKAFYVDNEGHVIRYILSATPDGVAFTSEPGPGPRFRLTYLRKSESLVNLRFEIAPPNKPEAFATYLEAVTRKVK